MRLAVMGAGYVGLVTGAAFAEMGHTVTCIDIDEQKIEALSKGISPIYEPGLEELMRRNQAAQRLFFTTDLQEGILGASLIFLALPTPAKADGSCNLTFLLSGAQQLAKHLSSDQIVVNKSTVPVGTTQKIKEVLEESSPSRGLFTVISNPEFLKEGSAIQDCMKPDRVILGVESKKEEEILRSLYAPFMLSHDRILVMDIASAELTKYAANAMLATRISFMNELSLLCEKSGANIHQVRLGIGSDKRIGYAFLYAGLGYGGSCFPKDLQALLSIAKELSCPTPLLSAVEAVNRSQQERIFQKIVSYFTPLGGLEGKTITLWGLSFKPETDDLREAPALYLLKELLKKGAKIQAFDPVAMPKAKALFRNHPSILFADNEYEASLDSDAIILATEWKQFRFVDLSKIKAVMKGKGFFDGRNQYRQEEMEERGFDYFGIGTPHRTGALNPPA